MLNELLYFFTIILFIFNHRLNYRCIFSDLRITKLSVEEIQKVYELVKIDTTYNLIFVTIPMFIVVNLFYSSYQFNYIMYFFQIIGSVGLGLICNEINNYIRNLKEIKKYEKNYNVMFGFRTFYMHPTIYAINLVTYLLPAILGYYELICNTWMVFWGKQVIYDNCDSSNDAFFKIRYK